MHRALARRVRGQGSRERLLMVAFGIALFVTGFVMTIAGFSVSGVEGARASDSHLAASSDNAGSHSELLLFVGMVTSLAGVVVATVGPVFYMLRTENAEQ